MVPVANVEDPDVDLALVAVVWCHPSSVHVDEVLRVELDHPLGSYVGASAEEGVLLRDAGLYGLVDELVVDLCCLLGSQEAGDVEEDVGPDHSLGPVRDDSERAVVVDQPDLRTVPVIVFDLYGVGPSPFRVPEWP